ncbi:hypothetical protein D3C72_2236800 [compost metagenome]
MAVVARPMIKRVTMKAYFLPTTSPTRPNTKAPKGLTIKPVAKVASVPKRAAVS